MNNKSNIEVYLIDDHQLFCDGMVSLLESRGIKTLCNTVAEKALTQLLKITVDAILLDLRMPNISGLEVLKIIKRKKIKAPVIMLTTSSSEKDLRNCLGAGAQGYLLKDMHPDELVTSIVDVIDGKIVIAKDLNIDLLVIVNNSVNNINVVDTLTAREKEVACHLIDGLSNKLIAKKLNITEGTVKLHIKAILRKLNLNSRINVAIFMAENNSCF